MTLRIDRMKRMIDEGAMHVRLWVMVDADDNATLGPRLDRARMVGYADNRLTVRAIKDMTDVPDEEITQARVAYTIIGGKVVYEGQ